MKAAREFAALRRFKLANYYYKKALSAPPSEDDVTLLVTLYGRAFFAALSEDDDLSPSGIAFGKRVLEILEKRYSSDPEFIQQMIEQLYSTVEGERKVAETELMMYRSVSLPALLNAFAEQTDEGKVRILQETLLMFGDGLPSALAAGLESRNEKLQLAAVRLLTAQVPQMNHEALSMLFYAAAMDGEKQDSVHDAALKALNKLSGKTLVKSQLAKLIETEIEKLQSDKKFLEQQGNDASIVVLWRWDVEKKALVPFTANNLTSYRLNSFRLSKALWTLYPQYPAAKKYLFFTTSEYLTTFTGTYTETELKTAQILKTPEFARLESEFSLEEVENYLKECLESKFYDAAVLAVLALGEKGDASLLEPMAIRKQQKIDPTLCVTNTESFSPIVTALHSPNRLLRFAALETVMKLNPQTPFSGSSRVTDTMAWFLKTNGHSKVLVADLTDADATLLGGRFRQAGLDFEIATSPRAILEKAVQYCDYTMILMNVRLLAANPDLLLQQLQMDPRTADIPVVLLANTEDFKKAEVLARRLPKCIWFPNPTRTEDLQLLLTLVAQVQTSVNLKDEQRVAETRAILLWTRDVVRSHQSGWVQKKPLPLPPEDLYAWTLKRNPAGAPSPADVSSSAGKASKSSVLANDSGENAASTENAAGTENVTSAVNVEDTKNVDSGKDASGAESDPLEEMEPEKDEFSVDDEELEMDSASEEALDDGSGDSELDEILSSGEALPETSAAANSPSDASAQASVPGAEPQRTGEWEQAPLQIYDVSKLIPPVLRIYYIPEFLKESLEVMRWSGTPETQHALAYAGSAGTFSYSASKRAALVLRENILRYGVLMTTKEVGDLYDLYNNTPAGKTKLLEVRGLVLDALEVAINPKAKPDPEIDVVPEPQSEDVENEEATEEDTADEENVTNEEDGEEYEDTEEMEDAEDVKDVEDTEDMKDTENVEDTEEMKEAFDDEELEDDKDAENVEGAKDVEDTGNDKDVENVEDKEPVSEPQKEVLDEIEGADLEGMDFEWNDAEEKK